VAARLRETFNAEIEMVHGRYGEFKVLVDGKVVVDGGAKVVLGIMPTREDVVASVRGALAG
jgi:hypothetical protein